ncbi:hypothetical protein Tco_1125113 [Tanacetum coccineum]|uniref:Uncharacterized protein n=1 Tax=Tanacetum coccineum TaxID=301880 RepID=A0ABQ5JB27_9ASTR
MQQQTNLQPASVSTSVGSAGTSRPSVSATNQDGASSSKDWIDDEFMRNLMTVSDDAYYLNFLRFNFLHEPENQVSLVLPRLGSHKGRVDDIALDVLSSEI